MIDSIASNTFVTILKDTEIPLKLGERSANWYLISYTSQEQKKARIALGRQFKYWLPTQKW